MPHKNLPSHKEGRSKHKSHKKGIRTFFFFLLFCLIAYFIYGTIGPYIGNKQVNSFWRNRVFANGSQGDQSDGPDRVRLLADREENRYAFLNAIDSAAANIKLVLHKETCGELSSLSAGALLTAAERGVKIDILADGKLKAERHSFFRLLSLSPLVSIREYAPISELKPWTYNSRLKDQFLLADDRLAWFSSAGSSHHDYPLAAEGQVKEADQNKEAQAKGDNRDDVNQLSPVFDWNVLVYNSQADTRNSADSVLSELNNYFTALWTTDRSREILTQKAGPEAGREGDVKDPEIEQKIKEWLKVQMADRHFQSALNNYRLETQSVKQISLLKNPVNDMNKEPYIWFQLSQLMSAAKESVQLCTPQLMLSPDMQGDLEKAVERSDLHIQVLTNSAGINPSFMRAADYTYNKGRILKTGIRLSEYISPGGFKGKSLLIDDRLTVLGSYDWTLSDTYLNTESVLVIDSPEINKKVNEWQSALFANSLQVKSDGSYVVAEDGTKPPQANREHFRQKPLLWLSGLFLQLFRSLL